MKWIKTAAGYEAETSRGTYEARRMPSGKFVLWLDDCDEYGAPASLWDCKDRAASLDEDREERHVRGHREVSEVNTFYNEEK